MKNLIFHSDTHDKDHWVVVTRTTICTFSWTNPQYLQELGLADLPYSVVSISFPAVYRVAGSTVTGGGHGRQRVDAVGGGGETLGLTSATLITNETSPLFARVSKTWHWMRGTRILRLLMSLFRINMRHAHVRRSLFGVEIRESFRTEEYIPEYVVGRKNVDCNYMFIGNIFNICSLTSLRHHIFIRLTIDLWMLVKLNMFTVTINPGYDSLSLLGKYFNLFNHVYLVLSFGPSPPPALYPPKYSQALAGVSLDCLKANTTLP